MSAFQVLQSVHHALWGPVMPALLLGAGIFLTVRTRFLAWRNLGPALRAAVGRKARQAGKSGAVSPFAALMTALAATIGTGNIVGVATALAAGGPGALVWMEISAAFGLTSKFAECMLAVKYREVNNRGEFSGGPMYTMEKGLRWKKLGAVLAFCFALFTVAASLGIGCMTQANSIAEALSASFAVPSAVTGIVLVVFTLPVLLLGIQGISRVCTVMVPAMAGLYLLAGLAVLLGNLPAIPGAVLEMIQAAFCPGAAAGGLAGAAAAAVLEPMRYGVARGCFSNEAGMGSAAIVAAASSADPVEQGYISMTGIFFDTFLICTVTGLAICSSGVLKDAAGADGAALTILAFQSVLGRAGGSLVTVCVTLFALSTILGWAYHGEKALEYLLGTGAVRGYRVLFALTAWLGATRPMEAIWQLSDIFNALMALPNLICLLLLSGTVAREMRAAEERRLPHSRRKE